MVRKAIFFVTLAVLSFISTLLIYLFVINDNRPPVLSNIDNKSVNAGQLLEFSVSANDPNRDILAYTATNLPPGATFDPTTRIFSWTPNRWQTGTYPEVSFHVSDGSLSASVDITIKVTIINRSPVIDKIGNKIINDGQSLIFTIHADDPDGDPLAYSASNLPLGAAFEITNHVFLWTPRSSQVGTYPKINFQVFDGSLTATEDITIKVDKAIYVVPAISDQQILPVSTIPSNYVSNVISITGSPGEFVPASFVIRGELQSLRVQAGDLYGVANYISDSNIDISVVKVWWQADQKSQNYTRILTPELLLKNDLLIQVRGTENYVELSTGEQWISGVNTLSTDGSYLHPNVFPINDTDTLQPIDIAADINKQFWVTVKIPVGTPAGTYKGYINVNSVSQGINQDIDLCLEVLPITLKTSPFIFSVYYSGLINEKYRPQGSISPKYKTETQLRAELKDMLDHGITNIMISQAYGAYDGSTPEAFDRYMQIIKETGFDYTTTPVFIGTPESNLAYQKIDGPQTIAELKELVESTISHLRFLGFMGDVYFYGIDEAFGAVLESQRSLWETIHESGGKVYVAGYSSFNRGGTQNYERMGDIQDLLICAGKLWREEAARWHDITGKYDRRPHKIFSYANPFFGVEKPETIRRNYGLMLWQYDYDGAMNYAYQGSYATIWNDFDIQDTGMGNYPDFVMAYPTEDGIIDTIQWEGFREGVYDLRYLATLQQAIHEAKADGKNASAAENWLAYLKDLDLTTQNLDAIRLQTIDHILELKNIIGK